MRYRLRSRTDDCNAKINMLKKEKIMTTCLKYNNIAHIVKLFSIISNLNYFDNASVDNNSGMIRQLYVKDQDVHALHYNYIRAEKSSGLALLRSNLSYLTPCKTWLLYQCKLISVYQHYSGRA